jgi:phosphoenolpyruvate synthase/pyruvate phosphate dikinase
MLRRSADGQNEHVELDETQATARVLSDVEISQLAELAVKDEAQYCRHVRASEQLDAGLIFAPVGALVVAALVR